MPRYRLVIEYDGTPYVGWQAQAAGRTVQQAIEQALLGFCREAARLRAAGRTDAGVHATRQIAHFDLAKQWPADVVRDAINAHLRSADDAIVIVDATVAAPDFDARFSAIRRHYLYRILARRAPTALDRHRVWHVPRPLDFVSMRAAAAVLVGRHDFSTFRAASCQAKSPVKTLERFECEAAGEEVRFHASARSFMHHQVRSMVGSVVEVGLGRWTIDALRRALDGRDRKFCGPVAPARGLCFVGADYPDEAGAK